jgi:hypothetical protein
MQKLKSIISGIIAAIVFVCVAFSGFTIGILDGERTSESVGGMFISADTPSGDFKLMSTTIDSSDYSRYNIPSSAQGAQIVEAVVTPEDANVTSVDWYLNWQDSTVTEKCTSYVTIKERKDILSVIIFCTNPFWSTMQLNATVYGSSSSSASSSINMDYIANANNFTELTWDEINIISKAGMASKLWNLGDTKEVELTTGETISIQIIGFEHDDLVDDGTKAAITLQVKNCLKYVNVMHSSTSNFSGWESCELRQELNDIYYKQLPYDLQTYIKAVYKEAITSDTAVKTEDKLFLLSAYEVFGYCYYYYNDDLSTEQKSCYKEGEQYQFYKNAGILDNCSGLSGNTTGTCYTLKRLKLQIGQTDYVLLSNICLNTNAQNFFNSEDDGWWTRSLYYNTENVFCITGCGSPIYDGNPCNLASYISFAFCI